MKLFRHSPPAWLVMFVTVLLAGCFDIPPSPATPRFSAERYWRGEALQLAQAIDRRDAKAIDNLVRGKQVNPDALFNDEGMPMVAWPILNDNPEGLELLLQAGADPNARKSAPDRPRPYNGAMALAAKENDPRYLRLLLEHGGDPNARTFAGDQDMLWTAIGLGHERWENIKLLVEHGANLNADQSAQAGNMTILSEYAMFGNFDQAYWLLEHGADPTLTQNVPEGHHNHGRMMMVESIYWLPVKSEMVPWQRKCQRWLRDRGIAPPPLPDYLAERRKKLGLPYKQEDIELY